MADTTNNGHGKGDGTNPEVSWERKDVDIKQITGFGIGLLIAVMIAAFAMFGLFRWFYAREEAANKPMPQAMENERMNTPPAGQPMLQVEPQGDLKEMRGAEDMLLGSYGWVDRQKGIARIPIDQAIDMVAAKGLPSRPTPAGLDHDGYKTIPSVASSGRTLEKISQ